MIFRLLKSLALVVMVGMGLAGCEQLVGSSSVTDPPTTTKTSGNHGHHAAARLARTANGDATLAGIEIVDGVDPNPAAGGLFDGGNNLWDRLRSEFQLVPADDKPQVQAQINWFMHHQEYFDRTVRRSAPYMYYIFEQIRLRKIPAELALLPIIESAYNPFANSSVGAAGVWQLMPRTAYGFGVKQNFWYDGRRDIYASTKAALDYLTYLQSYFGGDWLLAIAAYDSGEGTVQMAVRRNARQDRNTDFWALPLPLETQSYVPRLLALASIIRDPKKYNLSLPPISDKPYLAQVDVGAPIDLEQAAHLADMSLAELRQFNPAYTGKTIDPEGPYKLILPIDKIALFRERLAATPSLPRTIWGRYKVQPGDTFASIANRYHVAISEIKRVNRIKENRPPVGRVIVLPTGTAWVTPHPSEERDDVVIDKAVAENAQQEVESSTSTPESTSPVVDETPAPVIITAPPAAPTTKRITHVVKKNDTLLRIAKQYKVKTADIQRWNKLKANKPLKIGSKLVILRRGEKLGDQPVAPTKITAKTKKTKKNVAVAKKTTKNTKTKIRPNHYIVKSGDNLSMIARRLNVKSADLAKWNKIKNNTHLKPGQQLIVK